MKSIKQFQWMSCFKGILPGILAMLIVTAPVTAQSETPVAPCTPDFSTVRDLLTQAEAASTAGDNAGLINVLQDARTQLGSIIKDCTVIELTETLTARGGLLTMNYPKGWIEDITTDNPDSASPTYIQFASSQSVFSSAGSSVPVINSGDQLIAVIFGTPGALISNSTVEPSATAILQGVLNSIQQSSDSAAYTFGEVETMSINDRRAARVEFSGGTFASVTYAIEFDGGNYFAVVLSLCAPDELDQIDPIVLELAQTIKYNADAAGSGSAPTEQAAPVMTATPAQ